MKLKLAGLALALSLGLAAHAEAQTTVRFWFHFDNPDNPMTDLVTKFEKENPGIKVTAENIPWGTYYDNLYTAIAGGNAPDAAMVKLFAQPRLVEMGALEPIDARIASWPGKADLLDNLLDINKGPDGKQYYLPVQYVVSYLYYRTDMFQAAGLQPPKTCDELLEAAKKLTHAPDVYGFGFRGAVGGHDHWASFVLSRGAKLEKGGLTNEVGIAGTQWVIDLYRVHKVLPPSTPNDGFKEIISNFTAGKTAMTIHHIGSSNDLVKALGDKVSAVPVPQCGGGAWTSYGDESLAVFASSRTKDATWKWISFLSTGENNVLFNKATGQLTVTKSGSANWNLHQKRFVDATVASLPFAKTLPSLPGTADFVNTVWPTNMQRAFNGEITAQQMNAALEKVFTE
jgi:multiple sugar transport system substrate-binding protein